jgi:redox-sensitive bicupin YhaK (pirin superfamily)
MSRPVDAADPFCAHIESPSIELCISARPRDVGGLAVQRTLPSMHRRIVGPFVFFDHFGPATLPPGQGMDVAPHPHIGLATVTYLFDGEVDHRDSLGTLQTIQPGDVNWMLAGRGIVHSERSGPEARRRGARMHGIQSWVALPIEDEEVTPRFEHHPAGAIPKVTRPGATLEIVAGTAYGAASPVRVLSQTLYVHALLDAGARLPVDATHEERAVYVVEGSIVVDGNRFEKGTMLVLRPGVDVAIVAVDATRAMLLGGGKLAGERHIEWNFVSSSKDRIERAKDDWRARRFATVPGDEVDRVPLPDERPTR